MITGGGGGLQRQSILEAHDLARQLAILFYPTKRIPPFNLPKFPLTEAKTGFLSG